MRTPFIIAEAGSCHEELWERAVALIDVAKECDADAIKFQYWSSPARMRAQRHVTDVNAYERGSVKTEWLEGLSKLAHANGLEFLCTAYLPEDIEVVAPFVDRFKVASFEANEAFVEAHQQYGKPIIVSTGMWDEEDYSGMWWMEDVDLLHCVSAYPAPLSEANLGVLNGLAPGWGWGFYQGYSDHTRSVYTGGFAVSAGADMLEVHFRLDDTSAECADYPVALSPGGLGAYVTLARLAHTMRGDGVKRVQPSEQVNVKHKVQS